MLARFSKIVRVTTVAALLMAVLGADAPLHAQDGTKEAATRTPRQPPSGFPADLDTYIAQALKDWGLPGIAVAVVRNDSVLIAKGYGVRELGHPERVDAHTAFDAASLTKSFTAAAVGTLVDEGKMRWDDPARRYLPELEFADPYLTANVTLRDLLAHRVGLEPANFMWRFTGYDRAEVIRRVRFLKPLIPFRTGMVYSNVGFTLIGEAAARAAGTTWEGLVRARLLQPLGMKDTFFWLERDTHRQNAAIAHAMIDDIQVPVDARDGTAALDARDVTAPAGSVQSSAWDLAQWMRFQLGDGTFEGKRILSAAALEELHSPQVIVPTPASFRRARQLDFFATYGMGWQVWDYRGHTMLWHSGSGNGEIAYMALLPKERLGVVVLVNSWRSGIIHAYVANRILDRYLGLPTRDYSHEGLVADSAATRKATEEHQHFMSTRVQGASPARPLGEYVGTYVDTLNGEISLRLERDSLTLQMARGAVADLSPWTRDAFFVRWRFPVYRASYMSLAEFTFDASGAPAAFSMLLNRDTVKARRK